MPTLTASLHYHVELHHLHAHQYRVTLRIATPAAQQLVSLPVWIPGSYLVREFAKNLQELNARQNGQPIAVQQLSKHQWQLDCSANAPVELSYLVNAYDTSVRTAWLDQRRGFSTAPACCCACMARRHNPTSCASAHRPRCRTGSWLPA